MRSRKYYITAFVIVDRTPHLDVFHNTRRQSSELENCKDIWSIYGYKGRFNI